MKIGIISDIHGNIDALNSVLKMLEKEEVDKIEDQKPETIDRSMNKFLSEGIKNVKDSESTIKAIPEDTVKEIQNFYKTFTDCEVSAEHAQYMIKGLMPNGEKEVN